MAAKMIISRTRTICNILRFHRSSTSFSHPCRIHIFLPTISLSPASEFGFPFQRLFSQAVLGSNPLNSSSTEDVNEICRVLSDFRSPHHDIESALISFSHKISTDLVEQVLKRCKNLGVSAHRFFLWAKKLPGFNHSKESHDILIDILGSSKQFPLIWDFLSEIKDEGTYEIQSETFWNIFRAYARANLPTDAIRAFKRMDDFGLKPNITDLDHLLFTLCKRKLVKFAQEFFDIVKDEFAPSPKTYSILMMGWGDLADSNEARKLFDEMLERGCLIDIVAYNTLLESLCRGGKPDEAYKLFREMRSHNLTPDGFTYSVFIRAACEANDIHSVIRVLDRMRRYNLAPNVFTFNSIIKLFCKNQRVDDAHLLLDEMIERGVNPDVWSYNAILAYHCDHSEVNQALKLLSRMEKDSCLPDQHTYNMLLKMLVKVGRFDRAMDVWESMGEKGYFASVSTYSVMIHGLSKKKGKIEDACKFFETMIDEGLPPYHCTCTMLRDRLLGLGLWEKTRILADKMQRSTSCSIQELSSTMKGEQTDRGSRKEEEQKPKCSILEEDDGIHCISAADDDEFAYDSYHDSDAEEE